MSKKWMIVVVLLLNLVVFTKSSMAQGAVDDFFDWLNFGFDEGALVGLGVLYSTSPYTDVDDSVFPVPLIKLKYKRFYVDGTSLGFYLIDSEQFRVSVVGAPHFEGYEADDSPALTGMDDREASFDGGLRGVWVNELFTLEVTGMTDLASRHEGEEVSVFIKHGFWEGALTPRVGMRWSSRDLVDYYYGVRPGEVRAGRPAYDPDSTMNFVAGVTLALPVGDKWAWVNDVTFQRLGDEIQDSPIVEDENMFTVVSGFVYRY